MAMMVIGLDDGAEYILPWSFGEDQEKDTAAAMALSLFRGQVVHVSIQPEQDWSVPPSGSLSLHEHEHDMVVEALHRANWSQTEAAKLLGITKRQMFCKVNTHKINAPPGHRWIKAR